MSHSEDLESLKNELSTPEHLKDFDVSMKKYLESKNADLLSITIAIVARDKNECTNALFIASGPRSNNSDNLSSCFPLMCMVSPRPEDEEETILQEVHKQVSILPGKRVTNIAKVLGGSNDDDIETRRMMYEGEDIPVEFKRVVYLTFVVDIDPDCGFDENGTRSTGLSTMRNLLLMYVYHRSAESSARVNRVFF